MPKKEKIAANVVTYNRKDLLRECLNSLLAQTRKPDSIIIVDNNSNDGTKEMLEKEFLDNSIFDYVRLNENTGSAGGQYTGIKRAYEKGFDWVWCMDDDTVTKRNSLKELETASGFLKSRKIKTGFLANNVFWVNGDICKLNRPALNRYSTDSYKFLGKGLVEVWSSSFVGMFISAVAIKNCGLPIKEYFIWGDDVEYSLRISQKFKCYLVGKSKVTHKTKTNNNFSYKNITADQLWKYEYSIRNLNYTIRNLKNKRIKRILISSLLIRFLDMIKGKQVAFLPRIFISFMKGFCFNPKVTRRL
jgi:GT2 family glycosyltransferase